MSKALKVQEKKIIDLSVKLDKLVKKETAIFRALGLPKNPKDKRKGRIEELQQSIINLEEYLLNTASRIDNILKVLKTHREFLMRVNKRVYKTDAKGKIKMELDIMKNTLSILTMNGIDFGHRGVQGDRKTHVHIGRRQHRDFRVEEEKGKARPEIQC